MIRVYAVELSRLVCVALSIAVLISIAGIACAQAKGNAQFWPRYVETESIVTIAPYGVWIDDRAVLR